MENSSSLKKIELGKYKKGEQKAAFDANRANYAEISRRISARMYATACEFAKKPDWGTVEQEKDAVAKLAEVLGMLGDRSACDELGISW